MIHTLQAILQRLEASGLIRLAPDTLELEYWFNHALMQDAAYASLLKVDRRALHERVGRALEALYPERQDELAPILARHFQQAGATAAACHYFILAGESALARYANREAEQLYRAALELAPDTAGGAMEDVAERARVQGRIAETLAMQAIYPEALSFFEAGIATYRSVGAISGAAGLYAAAARAAWIAGLPRRGLGYCQEGLALTTDPPETIAWAVLLAEVARTLIFNALPEEAPVYCAQALALAERLGDERVQAEILVTRGMLPNLPLAERVAAFRAAIALGERLQAQLVIWRACNNLADLLVTRVGDIRGAHESQARAVQAARIAHHLSFEAFTLGEMTESALALGRFALAEELFAQTDKLMTQLPSVGVVAQLIMTNRGRYLRYHGRLAEAQAIFAAEYTAAREAGESQMIIVCGNLLVDVALELGQVEQALTWGQAVLTLGDLGIGGGEIITQALLAAAYARQGAWAEAEACLARVRVVAEPEAVDQERLALAEARVAVGRAHWAEADAAFAHAAELEAMMSKRWRHARTICEWGDALVTQGALAQALACYRAAEEEYRALGVTYYHEQVRARLARLHEQSTS